MSINGICFVGNSANGMELFDYFPPSVKRLFFETEQNICAYCAANIIRNWFRGPLEYAPLEMWIEVIRQMESGEISDNPYSNIRADRDYRGGALDEREFAYQRFGGRGQNFYSRYDRPNPFLNPNPIFGLQQTDRDGDAIPPARQRYVQDLERNRPRCMGAGVDQAPYPQHKEVL